MVDFGLIFHIVIPLKACPQSDWGRESRTRANTPGFRVSLRSARNDRRVMCF